MVKYVTYLNLKGMLKLKNYVFRLLSLMLVLILSLSLLAACGSDSDDGNSPDVPAENTSTGNPAVDDGWELILVNADNPVPDTWVIPETTELSEGRLIDSRIYPALQEMFNDARSAGLSPVVSSGYRTYETQQQLWDEKYNQLIADGYSAYDATIEASHWVAPVGTSEHHLGIAFDIGITDDMSIDTFYDWFETNSWKYGFVRRYPDEKIDITGIGYEPWHYRYVGTAVAKEMYEKGLCLEEYLAQKN